MKTIQYFFFILLLLFCLGAAAAADETTPGPVTPETIAPEPITIDQAVFEALENNPLMTEASENMAADEEGVKSARADLLPGITAGYGYTALKEKPIMKTETGAQQIAHRHRYNWNATVVQPLFTGFALVSRYQLARLDVVSGELEKEQARLDVTHGVRSACYNRLLAEKLLMVSDQEVETLTAHKRDAGLFFKQGLIPRNDLLRSEVALSNAVQQQERARAEVNKAQIAINRLLNRPLDTPLAIADVGNVPAGPAEAETLCGQAREKRPLLKLLDTGMQQLGLTKRLARSGWYPTVSLVASYEQLGENPNARRNDYNDADNSYVAIQAEWKLFEGGKTIAEVNRTKRQIRALKARIEAVEDQVMEEVRSAWLDCRVTRTNIETASTVLEQARENWRITDLQYREQAATSTDVMDARDYLTQADTNYYRALYGYLNALAVLDRAVGR